MEREPNRSTGDLLAEAMESLSGLIRSEIGLARAEMSETLHRAIAALVILGIGALLVVTALNVLAAALVTALIAQGMAAWLASTLVGVGLILVAIALSMGAVATLKSLSFAPKRAAQNIRRDAEAVKEAYND